jgi:hypothetical protein
VRQDPAILAMADKFVFLRIMRMNGVDLNQFRFDYDLTWMGFFLSADGRVYARYGGRDADSSEGRISRDGLLHAMREVLRLHRADGARKLPPLPPPRRSDDLTMLKGLAQRNAQACIHCHMVNEAFNFEARIRKEKIPKDLRRDSFFSFPLPENVGIKPDLVAGNRVLGVVPGSPAAKAGLKKDDLIRIVQGQPVVTAFDIQYGLNEVGAENRLTITAERQGRELRFDLYLPADWRRRDVSWRKSLQNAPYGLAVSGEDLSPQAKADLKIPPDGLAYHVLFVPAQGPAALLGLRAGDVIVAVDGKRKIPYRHFRAYFPLDHEPGDRVELIYLRDGKEATATLTWK